MSRAALFSRSIAAFAMSFALILAASAVSLSAAHAEPVPHLRAALSPRHPDILVMIWKGRIQAPMSDEIISAFQEYNDSVKGVELKLDSDGGSVAEGERVIAVLQEIKKTRELHTVVAAGKRCGSMCVFIYVQGQKRLAAPASLWLFHEVSHKDPRTHQVKALDRSAWERLVDKYWMPAGVDRKWIENVKSHTVGANYWQSGDSLLQDGANIIQKPLSDEQHRAVKSSKVSASAE